MGISKIKPLTSQYHSVGGSRGRGLLCLAPQLVVIFILLYSSRASRYSRVHDVYGACTVSVRHFRFSERLNV